MVEDILLEPGEVLFDTEIPLATAFFILEGSVDLELALGEKSTTLNIGVNHFVGDVAVAVSQNEQGTSPTYRGKAVVREQLRAVPIPIDDIKKELENCSPLLKAWFASFTSRVLMVIESLSHS